jgi:predicted PurR-regulated permease PerM
MARGVSPTTKTSRFVLLASVCVVVAALYFAQDVLIPVALSVLLTFLLTPSVYRLERMRLPRPVAVLLTVVIAFGALGVLGYVVGQQILTLASNIDQYKENIEVKVEKLRPRSGTLDKLTAAAEDVSKKLEGPATTQAVSQASAVTQPTELVAEELSKRTDTPRTITESSKGQVPNPATQPTRENPLPVAVVEPNPSPMQTLGHYLGLALGPLGTAGIVIVFVIFMLLQREDLRNRLIRLIGYGQLTVTTQALDDAASRISRYLVAQAIVNGTYGGAIALGLWLIGKFVGHGAPPFPNVILWGLLCCVLRFIPYIGPWIAAAFPLVLSLAVYRGWEVFAATVAMFVVIELLSNNIMEPLLYGSSTGMSAVAVLVSAVFWTWLWGPIGLLLATPLTVVLVVLGKYVPQLQFLDILLGDEPVLSPHERVYQRWLALDHEEAEDLVEELLTDRSLEQVYDQVLLPALALAEHDRHKGRLDDQRQTLIRRSLREMIDELGDFQRVRVARSGAGTDETEADAAKNGKGAPTGEVTRRVPLPKDCSVNILVLPARDEADEIVGLMLNQLLEFGGYCATAMSHANLASEMVDAIDSKSADVVAVSALPPAAVSHSRYICKRLHARYPDVNMVVGLWTVRANLERAKERITCEGRVQLVTTLADAMDQIEQLAKPVVVRQQETAKSGGNGGVTQPAK